MTIGIYKLMGEQTRGRISERWSRLEGWEIGQKRSSDFTQENSYRGGEGLGHYIINYLGGKF